MKHLRHNISTLIRVFSAPPKGIFIYKPIISALLCYGLFACTPSSETSESKASSGIIVSNNDLNTHLKNNFHSAAHWLTKDILVLPKDTLFNKKMSTLQLISLSKKNDFVTLSETDFPLYLKDKHPHLKNFQAFFVNITQEKAKLWLKHGLVVAALFEDVNDGNNKEITRVQFANVLDDLYTQGNNDADEVLDLGATIADRKKSKNANYHKDIDVKFKVWAPTASHVSVYIFDEKDKKELIKQPLIEDVKTGIWSANLTGNYHLAYYQYEITVHHNEYKTASQLNPIVTLRTTDPYSLSLSSNSVYSQIIDLNSDIAQPSNWLTQPNIVLAAPEDAIIYETHIRDFSGVEKHLSNENFRGKYKAFTETNTDGIKHITELKNAGLNHIHLLPTFDLGTINENEKHQISLTDTLEKVCRVAPTNSVCLKELDKTLTLQQVLESFDPKTMQAQKLVSKLRTVDNYNWGYDPYHYTVPEGSYAVNPEGHHRIIEFREMVQSLHEMGFRVIMDVVYNHTHQAGLNRTSVLDKIVPTYYQRLHPITGQIEQSTCCDNTATEHVMMEKLMIDSLVTWAKEYKIDGFRFDLMGHQPKISMIKARNAVREIDADTYFYGEGWNFGEVANNQQFVQASQFELAGTEIGTFTDRLRDAVRGSSFNVSGFDHRKNQGIGNGLGTFNNEMQNSTDDNYSLKMDQLRVGLAGNLANFPLENSQGQLVEGKDIAYGDQSAGYAFDPADTINYVSKHDNQTLWDNSQYRMPHKATIEQRVRLHNQSLSYALLAQGIPFLHMGAELLRSKSFLRDSYDYSDWFNAVDYSKTNNNYNVGLPPKEKDEANWPLITQLLSKNEGRDLASKNDIEFASSVFQSFLKIRSTTKLFRLTSEQAIIDKVSFLNSGKPHQKGLIVMQIDNNKGTPVKSNYQKVIVIFNNNPTQQFFNHQNLAGLILHPVQNKGKDLVTATSQIIQKDKQWLAEVPAFTTAVFVTKK